jgi:phosphoglycolate phosphatase-like HAD superfamily hydrolase
MGRMPQIVLFDIDGTLLTTRGAAGRAWRLATRRVHGLDVDIQQLTENGMTDRMIARVVLTNVVAPDKLDEARDTLLAARDDELATLLADADVTAMPGASERLAQLRADGVQLGVVTGNTERAAALKLDKVGLGGTFAFGAYGDVSESRADLINVALDAAEELTGKRIDVADVVTVGDTPRDVEAARAVGTKAVAVTTGRFDRATLEITGADAVLDTLAEEIPFVTASAA